MLTSMLDLTPRGPFHSIGLSLVHSRATHTTVPRGHSATALSAVCPGRQWWRRWTTNHGSHTCGPPPAEVRPGYSAAAGVRRGSKGCRGCGAREIQVPVGYRVAPMFSPCPGYSGYLSQTLSFCSPSNCLSKRLCGTFVAQYWSG